MPDMLDALSEENSADPFALPPRNARTRVPATPPPSSSPPPSAVKGIPAMGGKRVSIPPPPPLPEWGSPAMQDMGDGVDETLSYTDLETLNKDLLQLRIRMNRIRRDMREAGRAAVTAKLAYQRAFRRALIQQSGGSAEMRKASAELLCEELEVHMAMTHQVAEEYASLFRGARDDVDNAKTVSYNLRSLLSLQ